MSRAPPFPATARSPPPTTNGAGAPYTRPLQISRPSRPTTPSNAPMNGASGGTPSRPSRSDLRPRQSSDTAGYDAGSSRGSAYARGEADTAMQPRQARNGFGPSSSGGPGPRGPPKRSDTELSQTASPALDTVLSAFQSAGIRKRANTIIDEEAQREREQAMEIQQQTQQRIRERVPGRRRVRAGDIDAVLDQINDEWAFVKDDEFNPVDLALQLLDESGEGQTMDSFRRTKIMLSKSLKGSVDRYHQAFAASLPQHSSLFGHMDLSQAQVKEARAALLDAKEALGNKRADLVQIWSRGQAIEEMIRILDQIENLKTVADLLESLISEKRFLQASVLLVQSLKMANKPDMQDIGAVADLRSYLLAQESALREILVDELSSHLYLKSFWCESRWGVYNRGQQTMPEVQFEHEPSRPGYSATYATAGARRSRLERFLDDLMIRTNESPYDINDANLHNSASSMVGDMASQNQNPESDSFAYMETLLESLAVLGRLGNALDILAQRVPAEIYTLVESSVEEAAERADFARRASILGTGDTVTSKLDAVASVLQSMSSASSALASDSVVAVGSLRGKDGFLRGSSLRLPALESASKLVDQETLRDLFWTIYSKLDAVAQGLRVISEVSNRIGSRRDFKDASGAKPGSLFPLMELWMPINAEMRTLLNDYITDAEQSTIATVNPVSSINEVLRDGRLVRDKTKHAFRFAETDLKTSNKALKAHEDELTQVLRDFVPGLVQGPSETTVQSTLSALGTDERMLGSSQHHRLLIKPDAFHVSVLFQPTLAFLSRIADILPSGMESARASTAVLDEFVLKVYLPQLEQKVTSLFLQAVSGPEAFQVDPASLRLSAQPLNKATTQIVALNNTLCAMLRSSPFHRENYARLIMGVIIQFYQRCYERFQLLASVQGSSEESPAFVIAAQWAQLGNLAPCLAEMFTIPEHATVKMEELCRQETQLELTILAQGHIQRTDVINSLRDLAELCSLHRSVAWFVTDLISLKMASDEPPTPATPSILDPLSATTPFTPTLPGLVPLSPDEDLKLPLSRDMAMRFQALLRTYDLLAELILCTIRIDVRCRVIHHLELAMQNGDFAGVDEDKEPDPHIVDLDTELAECDDAVSAALAPRERRLVFCGLAQLSETLLISNARYIRAMTPSGVQKISRTILAVQQGLKMLAVDEPTSTDLVRAKQYYALLSVPPADMIAGIRQAQVFSFDEYRTMLGLQCGVDPTQGEAGAQEATDRGYSGYMIDLAGLELENTSS